MSPHEKNLIMHTTYFYCYINRFQEFISIRALFKRGMHYNETAIINYDTSVIDNVINYKDTTLPEQFQNTIQNCRKRHIHDHHFPLFVQALQ